MNEREIKRLIRIVEQSSIQELEITQGDQHIRITKTAGAAPPAPTPPAPPPTASEPADGPASIPPAKAEDLEPIVAPIVGTFYAAPAPDASPFVEEGTRIEVGQTVCIIEAMKVMNPIGAEIAGVIRKILVENAQPVEYGESLFLVEPA